VAKELHLSERQSLVQYCIAADKAKKLLPNIVPSQKSNHARQNRGTAACRPRGAEEEALGRREGQRCRC